MNTIKDILAHPEPNAIDFLDTVKLNLLSSSIYVFTPKGDLMTLPSGATVLDLAFTIHSELGMHCIAGKINHRLVPLNYELESGDQVEIITSNTQTPQPEWMEYCHTAKAQNRLRSIIRKDKRHLCDRGKILYLEFLEKENLKPTQSLLDRILAHYTLEKPEDLYLMLANDEINLNPHEIRDINKSHVSLLGKLLRNPFGQKRKNSRPDEKGTPQPIDRKKVYVLHPDAEHPNYLLDTCCNPIPGDDVLGFVDEDEKVVVHKVSCPKAMRLKSTYGPRLVATRWEGKASLFTARITIDGIDRHGILEEIAAKVSKDLDINIRGLNIEADQEVFHC